MKTFAHRSAGAALALCLTLGLAGCDDLLDVELPSDLTADALQDPVSATSQLNSIIVRFENGLSDFMYTIHGHEDGGEVVLMSPQIGTGIFGYTGTAPNFADFMQSRRFAVDLHEKLTKWTVAQVPQRARYLAISSLYEGAVYGWMASTLCEGSLDAGKLLTQAEMHALTDQTLTRAITEIGAAGGDFAMPFGISSSALNLAYGLRAQNRWMAGDLTGARSDAERIPQGFYAYITREATATRRNLPYYNGPRSRFAALQGVVDWWNGAVRQPNPATGQLWPQQIPFTGYQELGILPDGRATRDNGLPIRLAGDGTIPQNYRDAAIENTAVRDTRTPTMIGLINGRSLPTYIATKYNTTEAQYMPLVNWQEMVLIRAEAEGGAGAIARVNQLRTVANLPQVTYLQATDANGIRRMIIEERRRALMLEGRFYYTKLKNLDLLWFPRRQGNMPAAGSQYQGGVRMAMPDNEYQINPNVLDLNQRGSSCDAKSKPSF